MDREINAWCFDDTTLPTTLKEVNAAAVWWKAMCLMMFKCKKHSSSETH